MKDIKCVGFENVATLSEILPEIIERWIHVKGLNKHFSLRSPTNNCDFFTRKGPKILVNVHETKTQIVLRKI